MAEALDIRALDHEDLIDRNAEKETLKRSFHYLVDSIDAAALLPAALSASLISDQQRSDCASEADPYKKAEKFVSHLQRVVNGDSTKFHTFLEVLRRTNQRRIASRLQNALASYRAATAPQQQVAPTVENHAGDFENVTEFRDLSYPEGDFENVFTEFQDLSYPEDDHVLVPDELVQELVDLRFSYANFLRKYKEELKNSFEAQETFVETLPTLITGKELPSDHSFKSYFKMLIDEEVSLFNITYLDKFCKIFPADIRAKTENLVDEYKQQCQHFMDSTTVNQFQKLFLEPVAPSNLLIGKVKITAKLERVWGDNTINDLARLVDILKIRSENLHLYQIRNGCIAVIWLCSISDVEEQKKALWQANVSLQNMGVLQLFIGEDPVFLSTGDSGKLPAGSASYMLNNQEEMAFGGGGLQGPSIMPNIEQQEEVPFTPNVEYFDEKNDLKDYAGGATVGGVSGGLAGAGTGGVTGTGVGGLIGGIVGSVVPGPRTALGVRFGSAGVGALARKKTELDRPKFEQAYVYKMKSNSDRKNYAGGAAVGGVSGGLAGAGTGGVAGAGVGAPVGGILGSVVPGPGTALGALIGTGVGGGIGALAGRGAGGGIGTDVGAGIVAKRNKME